MLEALGETRIFASDSRPEDEARPGADVPSDDTWLLARLRRGDEAAFEAIYRRQERRIYAFALRLAQRPDEAADLTQEVFVKAWENRSRFESLEHLARWLRRVVVNDWINALRRSRPLELAALTDDGEDLEIAAPQSRDSGIRLDLERAIGALTPRLRAVFLLFDLHGHGHEEIAELMQMTAGASKVQLHRARRRLQELLQ